MGLHERDYYREDTIRLQPDWDGRTAVSYLLILNIAIYIANILLSSFKPGDQGLVNNALMLVGSDATKPWLWWHTLTYAFAHDASAGSGVLHLLFNMLGLYFLGRSVEDRYGKWEFLRIYLFAAIVCGIGWLAKNSLLGSPEYSLLGASGAVICIEMLFVFNFPKQIIYFFVFPIPAWVLGVFLVLSNLITSPTSQAATGGPQVAVDVHIMGILIAVAYFFMGWNFSFVQDFNGTLRRMKRKWFGPKLRIHDDLETSSSSEDAEADRILAKIHEQGKDSLTSKERKFMEKYSRKVRARKQEF